MGRQPGDDGYVSSEANPNGDQPVGMSWFPGYAIDVGTGERLNMAFGEDSWLGADNGKDMIFNPSDRIYSGGGGGEEEECKLEFTLVVSTGFTSSRTLSTRKDLLTVCLHTIKETTYTRI